MVLYNNIYMSLKQIHLRPLNITTNIDTVLGLCWATVFPTLNQHREHNNKRLNGVGLMLGHRLRRWPNIKPTSGQHLRGLSITSDYITMWYIDTGGISVDRNSRYNMTRGWWKQNQQHGQKNADPGYWLWDYHAGHYLTGIASHSVTYLNS